MIGLYGAYKLGKYHARTKPRVREESPEEVLFWWTCAGTLLAWPVALFIWLKNKWLAHAIHIGLWTFIIFNGWEVYFLVGFISMCIYMNIQIWRNY
jgi:hypothetical protein